MTYQQSLYKQSLYKAEQANAKMKRRQAVNDRISKYLGLYGQLAGQIIINESTQNTSIALNTNISNKDLIKLTKDNSSNAAKLMDNLNNNFLKLFKIKKKKND